MSTPDLLATIVAATRCAVRYREAETPLPVVQSQIRRRPRGDLFTQALSASPSPRVVAECKRRSPSRGILRQRYDPAAHAVAYARSGAAAISVLTEPTFFDGSLEHLADVSASVDLPLLRKDFIVTRYQVVEAAASGADAILLIAGALAGDELGELHAAAREIGLAALVEVHDRDELDHALAAGASIVGVNSRNLRTLTVDLEVPLRLIEAVPPAVVAVAESGIRERADIDRLASAGYDAFLVGERLIAQADPGVALRELRGQGAAA